jgi:hypothetical protein
MNNNKNYEPLSNRFILFILILLPTVLLLAPIAILMVFILLMFSRMPYCTKRILFSFFMPCFFGILSIQKMPSSDLSAYIEAIKLISDLDFLSVLNFHFLSLRPSEFIFNYYIYLIAQIDKSGFLFLFLSTFIIYLLFIRTLLILDIDRENRKNFFLIIIAILFISMTFTLVGHLIRQYLACAVLFYGLALLQLGKNKVGWGVVLSSLFIHNSMAPFVIFLPIILWGLKSRSILTVLILTTLVAIYVNTKIDYIKPFIEIGFIKNDGAIPLVLVVFDLLLFSIYFWLKYKTIHKLKPDIVLAFSLLQLSALLSIHSVNLLFLRYYFINDFLRGYFILYIITRLVPNKNFNFISLCLLIFGVGVFILRTSFSPWDYGLEGYSIINLPLFHMILRIIDVWM